MGIKTQILYCDSTVNPIVGCDGEGCELFKSNICYAQTLVNRYAGHKGWPKAFDQPAYFPERLERAIKWADLTGTNRPDKPWLNGYPRVIFLNDLSDTFTRSAPKGWLTDFIEDMEASPHIWLLLTKQVPAMLEFFWQVGRVPKNFWIGTTVTSQATIGRAVLLSAMGDLATTWLSIEPLLDQVVLPDNVLHNIDWVCTGGASGPRATPMHPNWPNRLHISCEQAGIPFFFKQWGEFSLYPRTTSGLPFDRDLWSIYPSTFVKDGGNLCMVWKCGKELGGRMLNGREWSEMPQFPTRTGG